MITEDFFDDSDYTPNVSNKLHISIIENHCDKYWKTYNLNVGELINLPASERRDQFKKLIEFKVKNEIDQGKDYADLLEAIVAKYSALIVDFNA